MEIRKIVPVWVSVLLVSFSAVTVGYSAWYRGTADAFPFVIMTNVFGCVSLIFSVFYCLKGYRKNAAVYFKIVSLMNMLCCILSTCNVVQHMAHADAKKRSAAGLVLNVILIVAVGILTFGRDLGRKKSMRLAAAAVAVTALRVAVQFFLQPETVLCLAESLVIYTVYLIMVYAKYEDKTVRGTK